MHKILFGLLMVLTSVISSFAQIGGISSSKINSINAATLPVGVSEFEPTYNYLQSDQRWDESGNLQSLFSSTDSLLVDGSLNLRMAYSFTDRLEVGSNLGIDYSNFSFKYTILTKEKLGLGIMGGTNHPFGFAEIDRSKRSADQISTYGIGGILSYDFNEKNSIDFNVQVQDYFRNHADLPDSDLFVTIDYGHYMFEKILFMGSFIYQESFSDDGDLYKLTFSPGISYERKDNYHVVLNLNFDIAGRSVEKTSGLGLSFTITL